MGKPGFPGGSHGEESTHNVRDSGSIPGSGRSSEEKNGNPLQYSCLENSMEPGGLQSMGSQKDTTEQLTLWGKVMKPLSSSVSSPVSKNNNPIYD